MKDIDKIENGMENNGLPEEGIQDALRKLTTFENAELVQKNERSCRNACVPEKNLYNAGMVR